MKEFRGKLAVLGLSDNGIQCATITSPDAPFWLPRGGSVTWVRPPQVGGSRLLLFLVGWRPSTAN
jgi:hypothetical protein